MPKEKVLGHEFMGIVEEAGSDVKTLQIGDRVVVPFPIACGACFFCQHGLPGHCENSNPKKYGPEGGLLDQKGSLSVRRLFSDAPPSPPNLAAYPIFVLVLASDQDLPHCIFLRSRQSIGATGGQMLAVFGCGPVGLMAMKCAWLRGAKRVYRHRHRALSARFGIHLQS